MIGGDYDSFDSRVIIKGFQNYHHLNSGAIGVGDDPFMVLQILRVHLWHHQRDILLHPESTAIIYDNSSLRRCQRSIFSADLGSG
nr:hypothetical protein [Candidatus Hakubella thermalkaliphila]